MHLHPCPLHRRQGITPSAPSQYLTAAQPFPIALHPNLVTSAVLSLFLRSRPRLHPLPPHGSYSRGDNPKFSFNTAHSHPQRFPISFKPADSFPTSQANGGPFLAFHRFDASVDSNCLRLGRCAFYRFRSQGYLSKGKIGCQRTQGNPGRVKCTSEAPGTPSPSQIYSSCDLTSCPQRFPAPGPAEAHDTGR